MKHQLCEFWIRLTDRGFFALGLTTGLLLSISFLIVFEMIGVENIRNITSSDALPAWASVITALAAVYIAIKAHKFGDIQSKLSLIREISQSEFSTALLLQDLKIRMASEAANLARQMREAGYQERDIQDAVNTLADPEDQSEIQNLLHELMSGNHKTKGDRSYDDLMREWDLAHHNKTQFHRLLHLFQERSRKVNSTYLVEKAAKVSRNVGSLRD